MLEMQSLLKKLAVVDKKVTFLSTTVFRLDISTFYPSRRIAFAGKPAPVL